MARTQADRLYAYVLPALPRDRPRRDGTGVRPCDGLPVLEVSSGVPVTPTCEQSGAAAETPYLMEHVERGEMVLAFMFFAVLTRIDPHTNNEEER